MFKKAIAIFALICICIGMTACNQQTQAKTESTESTELTEPTEQTEPVVTQPKEYNYYSLESQGLLINFAIKVDSKYSAVVTNVDELISAIEIKEGEKSLIAGGAWQGLAYENKDELLSIMLEGSSELEKIEKENVVYTFYKLAENSA